MNLRTALVASLLLTARLAAASPTTSDGWYEEGQTQYTLGNFDKAVDAFKKGFELETSDQKKPSYLYNIAQAYRQANDCKNAVFFYKRFLAMKANDTAKPLKPETKADVDGWVKDGEACMKQQDALRNRAPDGTVKPGDDGSKKPPDDVVKPPPVKPPPVKPPPVKPVETTAAKPVETTAAKPVESTAAKPVETTVAVRDTGADASAHVSVRGPAPAAPHLLSVRLLGGGSKMSAGDLTFGILGTGTLLAGYPIAINDKLTLEAGAGLTFAQASFDNMTTGNTESNKMWGVFANAGVRYAATPKIGVRGDLGLGALVMSGLDHDGNVFTEDGVGATGALSMVHARVAASVDYLITDTLAVTLTPIAFGYSPAKSGLRSDISSITSLDFMVGLGYRM